MNVQSALCGPMHRSLFETPSLSYDRGQNPVPDPKPILKSRMGLCGRRASLSYDRDSLQIPIICLWSRDKVQPWRWSDSLESSSSTNLPFDFQQTQFPLQLAFTMTINKAQGQTLKHVGLCLTEPVFHLWTVVHHIITSQVQTCESLFQILLTHVVKGISRMLYIQKYLVNINVSFHVVKASSIIDVKHWGLTPWRSTGIPS